MTDMSCRAAGVAGWVGMAGKSYATLLWNRGNTKMRFCCGVGNVFLGRVLPHELLPVRSRPSGVVAGRSSRVRQNETGGKVV